MGIKRQVQKGKLSPISATSSAVHSITSAQDGLGVEQKSRQRVYFISMMIRTACFVSAVALPNPYRWFAIAGAVLLPYVAVVMANAGRETIRNTTSTFITKKKAISNN
jgi:Flp pilus assembly protein TadB